MSDSVEQWLRGFVSSPAFLIRYPYYAHVLARLYPVPDPQVDVMSVSARDRRLYLHVNVDFFLRSPQYLVGVLLHEVHHIVFGHLSQAKFRNPAHPDLMTLAMEISANEYIREPLPGEPARWEDYHRYRIRAGQSTMRRYELLVAARLRGAEPPAFKPVDDHHPEGVGAVAPHGPLIDPGIHVHVSRLLRRAVREADKAGGPFGPLAGLLAGSEPGKLLETLQGTRKPPERLMDWKAAIRMFIGQVRTPLHTYRRPSRRFPEKVGQVPGRMYYPTPGHAPPLVVAIDTSGSMSTLELTEVARQLVPLSNLVRITIVECDAAIQRIYPFQGSIDDFAGRGGTDLRPVFRPDFLRQHRPEGIIYFTDGEGPYPAEDPGVKTLWVLTKGDDFDCPWGTRTRLPRTASEQPVRPILWL